MEKSTKAWKHLFFFQKELMGDLARHILSCYIHEARAIAKEVETFEIIAYLTMENNL